jgi:SAM-dependent methyltransferase
MNDSTTSSLPYSIASSGYALKNFKYNSHYWILNFLSRPKRPLRILDVGTADGYLGAILKNSGHSVVGVEQDNASVQNAKAHYESFHAVDLETYDFPLRGEFDYILFADVLEHLRDPLTILRRSLRSVKPTGEVIVSVPNVANLVVRTSLLFGRFDYSERGILDSSHLRFFTLASFRELMEDASLRIVELVPTPLPVQLVFPITERNIFLPLHEVHYLLVRTWKTLLAYQFVARGVPAEVARA